MIARSLSGWPGPATLAWRIVLACADSADGNSGVAAEPGLSAALSESFEDAALAALGRFEPDRPVRLLGVRAEFAD
jgi:hypothetical protein